MHQRSGPDLQALHPDLELMLGGQSSRSLRAQCPVPMVQVQLDLKRQGQIPAQLTVAAHGTTGFMTCVRHLLGTARPCLTHVVALLPVVLQTHRIGRACKPLAVLCAYSCSRHAPCCSLGVSCLRHDHQLAKPACKTAYSRALQLPPHVDRTAC